MKAEELIGKVVVDVKRFVAGRVDKVHAPGEFISSVNKKPVLAPVIEMSTGETFVAPDESLAQWQVLDPIQTAFFNDINNAIAQATTAICKAAVAMKIPPKIAFLLLGRAYQVQGGILLKPEPGEEGEGEGWG
jgi:hypothetical protein